MGLILLVAVAGLAAWNKQHQPETIVRALETKPAEVVPGKPPPWPKPVLGADQQRSIATAPERPPRERVDRPGNESLEPEHVRRQVAQEFRGADTDGDGFLSREETYRFPFIAKEFQRVDVDGDGRISLQEFMQLRRRQAQQLPQK